MVERLLTILRVLAREPGDAGARVTYPAGRVDALAADYADALLLVSDCRQLELTPDQLGALERVDTLLERVALTRGARPREEIGHGPAWNPIRAAAAAALVALDAQP
jgi:hypothetical protein